jgi:GTP-binding protein
MKFIDEAIIEVEAGKGGAGSRHFRREKFEPMGGPDGGNGGAGGSVILRADRNVQTLLDFHFRPRWKAEDGNPGGGSQKDGRAGEDLIIKVPVGTQVFPDDGTGAALAAEGTDNLENLICDLDHDGAEFPLSKGGRGGKGNNFFKTATNQAPEHAQPGEQGEKGTFRLSLKLVADVGLVGFPNAGKSTLISRISAAKPKIADYPFTTLTPNLGVVQGKGGFSFVIADIPGLIPGAHEGKGLGTKFLKHVERTRVIAHLIDPNQLSDEGEPISPEVAFNTINHELSQFSPALASKKQIIVITKIDSIADRSEIEKAEQFFHAKGYEVVVISSVSGYGLPLLLDRLQQILLAS